MNEPKIRHLIKVNNDNESDFAKIFADNMEENQIL